jgi:hypothetical protein
MMREYAYGGPVDPDPRRLTPGTRYVLVPNRVFYVCLMGHRLHLGRPWAVGQTVDVVELQRPCPECFPYTRES